MKKCLRIMLLKYYCDNIMIARTEAIFKVFGSLEMLLACVSPDDRMEVCPALRCQMKADDSPMSFCHNFGQDSGNIRNYKQ